MHKSIVKRLLLILIAVLCLYVLSGCSFSDVMSKSTGITNDPDYQTWEKLNESGKLDSDGKYTSDAVHVSFASNSFLDVHYFRDQELQKEFENDSAYLFPGDMVYASVSPKKDSRDLYIFDRLVITEYTSENERGDKLNWLVSGSETALMVPYDYKGTEVAVEPSGHFGDRVMVLDSYLSDKKDNSIGKWRIDNDEQSSRQVSLNALNTYDVEYEYDAKNYYFVSSNPACWKQDSEDGRVVFDPSGPKTGTENFKVFLYPYLKAEITVEDGIINDIASATSEKIITNKIDDRKYSVSRLKEDSSLIINASSNKAEVKCSLATMSISDPEEKESNGQKYYQYKVILGDESKFVFIPANYQTEHGKLKFIYNGQEINERAVLNSGNVIRVEAAETEDGYWLPDNGKEITVNGRETASELSSFQFYQQKTVTVLLDKPTIGGTVQYFVGDEELTGQSADLLFGTRVAVKAEADEGWDLTIGSNSVYVVPDQNNQPVSIDGKGVNGIFSQKEAYKPILRIRKDNNLGDKCKISVIARDCPENPAINGNTVGTDQKIGTDESIRISFSSMDFGTTDNAVMVTATKKTEGPEYKEIHYVNKANGIAEISFSKDKHYKEIIIDLKAVKGEYFQTYELENVKFSAWFADENPEGGQAATGLSSGRFIHDDRKLIIMLRPGDGYALVGPDVRENGVYQREGISYRDYKAQIKGIVNEHLRKACKLNLNTDDPYGTVRYAINGKEKSGEISVAVGTKISISYILKDSLINSYDIEYKNGDFWKDALGWTGAVNNENSGTLEFEVLPEMDGKTITREQYFGIKEKGVN